jgi:hypothetical protein
VEAEQLLDGASIEGRFVSEAFELPRKLHEGERPVPDEVHRGLVTGNHQQEDHGYELVLAQSLARLLGLHQRRNQIVSRSALLDGDDATM